jgi:hypothetical protein
MKRSILITMTGLMFIFGLCVTQLSPVCANDLKDQELSSLVRKAYIYSFPVYEMFRTRFKYIYNQENPDRKDLNEFGHARKLADHTSREGVAPNNDTLYSNAWLDLSDEPLILSVPDTGGRYYSLAFLDFYTNNFAYVGRRVTGTKAGDYLVVGPKWNGPLPAGLPAIKSPTNMVWLLGRTLVDNQEDLPNLHRIQDQYKLTSLSNWSKKEVPKKQTQSKNIPMTPDPKDPWQFFQIVNLGLTENPPPPDEATLMAEFSQIGIGPNRTFDPSRFSEEQRKVILNAMKEATQGIRMGLSLPFKSREGWGYSPSNTGNYGKDYSLRAVMAFYGLGSLEPVEAVYNSARVDKGGKTLLGKNRYRLHFEKTQLPVVNAFWSISMYEVMPDGKTFFADNPIHRYSIGDRTKGVKFNQDGSLDIIIQQQSPGKEQESNWLPTPAGSFMVTFRAVQPGKAILDGTFNLPGIEVVD